MESYINGKNVDFVTPLDLMNFGTEQFDVLMDYKDAIELFSGKSSNFGHYYSFEFGFAVLFVVSPRESSIGRVMENKQVICNLTIYRQKIIGEAVKKPYNRRIEVRSNDFVFSDDGSYTFENANVLRNVTNKEMERWNIVTSYVAPANNGSIFTGELVRGLG